jgi:protein-tyrosine-phosphatase
MAEPSEKKDRDKARPHSVLFACTLNAVRSPMAEGLARAMLGSRIYVDSAGLSTASLDPFAVAAMAEIGIDIRDHNTQGFDDIAVDEFDVIVALSPEALARVRALTRHSSVGVEYWPTEDPTADSGGSRESRLQAYRAVRDGLKKRIRESFG